jgi:putative ATPase
VVLDLNAGSGLLVWEILRRVPEGGTWALARDRQAGEGLRQQAERLPELERPIVLVGEPDELPDLLTLRNEGELRFDAIVGRNAIGPIPDKVEALSLLMEWLKPGGRLSLAETVVRGAQRLYKLVDLSTLAGDLGDRIAEAEERIYAAPDDPLLNWATANLGGMLESAGFSHITVEEEGQESDLYLAAATLEHWFTTGGDRERPSYAQHLLKWITASELVEVQSLYKRQLANQSVRWRTCMAFVTGQRAE